MSDVIRASLKSLANAEALDEKTLQSCFAELLSGEVPPEQIGAFLMGLALRGETGKELLEGARVMRANARTIEIAGPVLDTCGTGGLGWTSLNTSTASAIAIAACGGKVAKHGNRSVPPKTGSADVLEALGVSLEVSEPAFLKCIEKAGVGFLFARTHHSAMRHVAPVRASLGIRTIFNLLGPLSNPAKATHQILGVYDPHWLRPMAEALCELGVTKAWVVHGVQVDDRAVDEISIAGPTQVMEVSEGSIRNLEITPGDLGLKATPLAALEGGAPDFNANAIHAAFENEPSPFLDSIIANAAAGLHILGIADSLIGGAEKVRSAISSGAAKATLSELARISQSGN